MPRPFAAPWFALLLGLVVTPLAHATTVVVPDQYPTVQGAIDVMSADTISIRDGDYAEDLVIGRTVTLMASPALDQHQLLAWPSVRGLRITSGTVSCVGLRFRGPVGKSNPSPVSFTACRLDAGLQMKNALAGTVRILGCQVFGTTRVNGSRVDVLGSTFIGCGLQVASEGMFNVRGNHIEGPVDTGLFVASADALGPVSENTVVGCGQGILFAPSSIMNPTPFANEVRDCAGNGITVRATGSGLRYGRLSSNIVRRCGGNGIEFAGGAVLPEPAGNVIDSVAGAGIMVRPSALHLPYTISRNIVRHATGHGFDLGSGVGPVTFTDNSALACGGDGIHTATEGLFVRNVAGRCDGNGIAAAGASGVVIRSNTFYRNRGSAIALTLVTPDSASFNIGYLNERYGVEKQGGATPTLACNDWYGNWSGAAFGTSVGATDMAWEPLFCAWAHDTVTLSAPSKLLPGNNPCGLVGALGLGCDYPSLTSGGDPPRMSNLAFLASPSPSRGGVRFTWSPRSGPVDLEVFDASGARRWRGRAAGSRTAFEWTGEDDRGRALPAGIYFARLSGDGSREHARVVLTR